jgi:hypothetical protein
METNLLLVGKVLAGNFLVGNFLAGIILAGKFLAGDGGKTFIAFFTGDQPTFGGKDFGGKCR